MIKKFIVIALVCICFFMFSCGKGEEEAKMAFCIPKELRENVTYMGRELINRDSLSKILNEIIIRKKEGAGNDTNSDATDYEEYLHKIWVSDEWVENDIHLPCDNGISFCITQIKDGIVEGKVSKRRIVKPGEAYEFQGIIEKGKVECQFDMGEGGYKGKFCFDMKDEDEIIVKLQYEYRDDTGKTIVYEGQDYYRPYNLSMEEEITIAKTMEVDLTLWGTAWIAVGWFDTSTTHSFKYHGTAYLINEDGDIFYKFSAPFRTGMWIVDAYLEDLNGDGLLDIKMIERMDEFPDIEDAVNFEIQEDDYEWHFLQREDGYFEDGLLIFG